MNQSSVHLRRAAAAGLCVAGLLFMGWSIYKSNRPNYGPPPPSVVEFRGDLSRESIKSGRLIDTQPTRESMPRIKAAVSETLYEEGKKLKRHRFTDEQISDLVRVSEGIFAYAIDPEFERDFAFFRERGLATDKEKAESQFRTRIEMYGPFKLAAFGLSTAQFVIHNAPSADARSMQIQKLGYTHTKVDVGAEFPPPKHGSVIVEFAFVLRSPTMGKMSKDDYVNVIVGCHFWWDDETGKWIPLRATVYSDQFDSENMTPPLPLGF